jgi:hypothetical protein
MYGFAAVSREPKPFPMIKIAPQKPPNDLRTRHGQAISAPIPYKQRPQIKAALYPIVAEDPISMTE